MNRSLLDDCSYDRVMLQLLGTAGTVRMKVGIAIPYTERKLV